MARYYVPYSGKEPVSVEVNGHRLSVLSQDKGALEEDLEIVGADAIKSIRVEEGEAAHRKFFEKFASKNGAGIVVLPPNIGFYELLQNLQYQLPWIQ